MTRVSFAPKVQRYAKAVKIAGRLALRAPLFLLMGIPIGGVSGSESAPLTFPCQLDTSNIVSFMRSENMFSGKFVFHEPTSRLALAPGGFHKDIAIGVLTNHDMTKLEKERKDFVGGFIQLMAFGDGEEVEFRLLPNSEYFCVNRSILKIKAYLESILRESNYDIIRSDGDYEVVIEAQRK